MLIVCTLFAVLEIGLISFSSGSAGAFLEAQWNGRSYSV